MILKINRYLVIQIDNTYSSIDLFINLGFSHMINRVTVFIFTDYKLVPIKMIQGSC